jgi:hypothetical protein
MFGPPKFDKNKMCFRNKGILKLVIRTVKLTDHTMYSEERRKQGRRTGISVEPQVCTQGNVTAHSPQNYRYHMHAMFYSCHDVSSTGHYEWGNAMVTVHCSDD